MELKEFIKEALNEAIEGIKEASEENKNKGFEITDSQITNVRLKVLIAEEDGKVVTVFGEGQSSIEIEIPVIASQY